MGGWFAAVGAPLKDIGKYCHSSSLIDKARLKKKNLKYEQVVALDIFEEFLLVIKFAPSPDFIGGKHFIVSYLTHAIPSIGTEVAITLTFIFRNYPDLRLGIVNGFVNFLKTTPNRDDISICSNVEVFAALIKTWAEEVKLRGELLAHPEGFYRVSCKIDAISLLLMSHPNSRIRSLCLEILHDFSSLEKLVSPPRPPRGQMPLAYILEESEPLIVKRAIYGFLESGFRGVDMSSKTASSFTPLAFTDVLKSSYTGLFRFYQAELAKTFSFHGRPKAVRHFAKHLKSYAVPLVEQSFPAASQDFKFLYSSYMSLMTAMAGVPLKSEIVLTSRPRTDSDYTQLLFSAFRPFIPYLLTMEKPWETKALLNSFYFLHKEVVQVFVSELMQW